MEFIGRVNSTLIPNLPSDLKDYILNFDSIDSQNYVGLSTNGTLVEFNVRNGKFSRALKISSLWANIRIIHDLYGQYQVVLTDSSNQNLQVFQSCDQTYKLIYEFKEKFIEIEIDNEPSKGHEVLKIQISPSKTIIKDFTHFQKSYINGEGEDEICDSVKIALKRQIEFSKQAVNRVTEDVKRLEFLTENIIHDLYSEKRFIKEADLLKATFNDKNHKIETSELVVKSVKHFKSLLMLNIENPLNEIVYDVRLILNHKKYKIKTADILDIDQMMTKAICETIVTKIGFNANEDRRNDVRLNPAQRVSRYLKFGTDLSVNNTKNQFPTLSRKKKSLIYRFITLWGRLMRTLTKICFY